MTEETKQTKQKVDRVQQRLFAESPFCSKPRIKQTIECDKTTRKEKNQKYLHKYINTKKTETDIQQMKTKQGRQTDLLGKHTEKERMNSNDHVTHGNTYKTYREVKWKH